MKPLTIDSSDLLANFLFPVPTTLYAAGPSALTSKERDASIRRNNDSTELECKAATWPLWAPHVSETTG